MRCSVFIATSLDGYIARRDGGLDWLAIVEQPGEDYGYRAFERTVDAIVIGRKTYETALGFGAWPYGDKRVVVLTHQPLASRHGEQIVDASPPELVERLARDGVQHAYIDGGTVIRQFLAANLIDDLTLSVLPMLLGDGIRLFGDAELRLALDGVRSWSSGLVQLRYTRASRNTTPPGPA